MAIFTGTPVEIQPVSPFLWIPDRGGSNGGFAYGSARYFTGFTEHAPFFTAIGKTTDGGATWTNFVQSGAEHWDPEATQVVLDPTPGAGKLIFFASNTNISGNAYTFYFDLEAETYSSNTDSGLATDGNLILARRPNGDVIGFYDLPGGTPRPVHFVQISGNAFGAPGTLDVGSGSELLAPVAAISDASNVIHVAYTVDDTTLVYNTLNAANTPGTRQSIASGASFYQLSNAVASTTLDSIIFIQAFSDTGIAQAFIGTPISGPAWATLPLHSSTPGLTDGEITAIDNGSTVVFLYQHTDSPVTTLQIMEVDWNGTTLTVPAIYWDIIANPPPDAIGIPASAMQTDGITAQLNSGTLQVTVTTVIFDDGINHDLTAVFVSTGAQSGYRNRGRLQWG